MRQLQLGSCNGRTSSCKGEAYPCSPSLHECRPWLPIVLLPCSYGAALRLAVEAQRYFQACVRGGSLQ